MQEQFAIFAILILGGICLLEGREGLLKAIAVIPLLVATYFNNLILGGLYVIVLTTVVVISLRRKWGSA